MGKLRIVTVVGARPQFIKAAPVTMALRTGQHQEILVHTGQHYDEKLSGIFFREMGIPEPDYNLGVGSGNHGYQTGEMLIKIEELLLQLKPNAVLVYGDTNSTLAGALAAAKLRIQLCHVESGLRSYNRDMPEEHNRVLTDHSSDLLFCPTQRAVDNLRAEGIVKGVFMVGDTMCDAVRHFAPIARERSKILSELCLKPREYMLATAHRPVNVDDAATLVRILEALNSLDCKVVFPVHPRTRARLSFAEPNPGLRWPNLLLVEPVGYLDMLMLEQSALVIITDSGGMQKEAFLVNVPCVTIRSETEWTETVETGWNVLAEPSRESIRCAIHSLHPSSHPDLYGDGNAAGTISEHIAEFLGGSR